jgi:hypothetical protein
MLSTPIAAILALKQGPDRTWAVVSAALAGLELIFVLVILIILLSGF